jgi:hypothetical protein
MNNSVLRPLSRVATSAVVLVCVVLPASVTAQTPTYRFQYADSVNEATAIRSLSAEGLFGEAVSYVEGSTEFSVTDVAAKTNVKLPLVFGRKLRPFQDRYDPGVTNDNPWFVMGTWEPDVPVIKGVYPNADAFVSSGSQRCSSGAIPAPPAIPIQGNPPVAAYNFWDGFSASIPGYGTQEVLTLNPSVILPTDGKTYKYATHEGWRISCISTLKNGVGQGYLITLPDGATYEFDWLAKRPITPVPVSGVGNRPRVEMQFYASKATDRFGNTLSYTYDPNQPNRLQSIVASDGASISIQYSGSGHVATVTSAGRVWQYSYAQRPGFTSQRYYLSSVTLPDLSSWALEDTIYVYGALNTASFGYQCNYNAGPYTSAGDTAVMRFRAIHPAGATGDFYFKRIAHGYNNLPAASCTPTGQMLPMGRPKASLVWALIRKTVAGAGLPTIDVNLTYSPSWSFASQCTAGCTNTATTVVTSADGRTERFTYGNDFQNNANQLLRHEVLQAGQPLRRTEHKYISSVAGQPFGDYAVGPMSGYSESLENPFLRRNRPRYETRVYQDGMVMISSVDVFDQFVRPTSSVSSSSTAAYPSP